MSLLDLIKCLKPEIERERRGYLNSACKAVKGTGSSGTQTECRRKREIEIERRRYLNSACMVVKGTGSSGTQTESKRERER